MDIMALVDTKDMWEAWYRVLDDQVRRVFHGLDVEMKSKVSRNVLDHDIEIHLKIENIEKR